MNKDLANKIESVIIADLKNRKTYDDIVIAKIIYWYRILNLNEVLIVFLYDKNLFTSFLLNIIHYHLLNKRSFTSKNKVLDMQLLFDFEGETFKSTNFWKKINVEFKQYLKTKKL